MLVYGDDNEGTILVYWRISWIVAKAMIIENRKLIREII